MAAALAARHCVNFIDDDGGYGREHVASRLRAQQDVERLRCRHDDVWRATSCLSSLVLWRIASAHPRADFDVADGVSAQMLANARKRRLEILLDVVRQRLQGRDVDDARFVRQSPLTALARQLIDHGQERGQRLTRTRRCGDEHILARLDGGPRVQLRGRRARESLGEPAADGRMKQGWIRGGVDTHGSCRAYAAGARGFDTTCSQ
jgi:hypothetical protein